VGRGAGEAGAAQGGYGREAGEAGDAVGALGFKTVGRRVVVVAARECAGQGLTPLAIFGGGGG